MADADLANHVNQYWPILKSRLRACDYHSQAVRSIEIPKPRVGTRQPDIPCVVDYLIQQALLQQLTPLLPTVFKLHLEFSPEQSAHQAVKIARAHGASGYRWCVEIDVESFLVG
ncbi:hypothetical protein [Pseudomonas sp. WHRI 8519]|uniref:hypothetical protein n=1 Tax=Pseudomonas sp. WHRI 8519 TaxID=3162567 RepID=UPI0032EEBD82